MIKKMTQTQIELVCKLATETFKNDRRKPGLVISWLGDEWYVSVSRYPFDGPVSVAKARGKNLKDVFMEATKQFASPAKEELKAALVKALR